MLLWLLPVAAAGSLYINDTQVRPDSVAGVTLERVTVSFDAQGNILIDAPGYKIQLASPTRPAAAGPAPLVPPATYWLVTEDNGSSGHTVECWINGTLAVTVRSGEPQKILDVGRWLEPGNNEIEMRSSSSDASGGSYYVYVGTGKADAGGTVVMDAPTVQFGLGSTREGTYEREYTLSVAPPSD
ncbi:MAG TPA: hypothetical protein ENK18_01625 [Deltaproteobacteria bacterium]|nr:hypothetical protein [Deltaproteobacteria bacterium]